MAYPPTARQSDLLRFIQRYTAEHGKAPTVREMVAGIGVHSTSRVHGMLVALGERGLIDRGPFTRQIDCLVNIRGETYRFIAFGAMA